MPKPPPPIPEPAVSAQIAESYVLIYQKRLAMSDEKLMATQTPASVCYRDLAEQRRLDRAHLAAWQYRVERHKAGDRDVPFILGGPKA